MSKIFVFGSAFEVINFMFDVEFLLDHYLPIDCVYLMEENHYWDKSIFKYSVCITNNVDECIENSDLIVVIDGSSLLDTTKGYIYQKSAFLNKSILRLECGYKVKSDYCYLINPSDMIGISQNPVVLHVSLGNTTQFQHIEYLLYKIFNNYNVRFHQVFTDVSEMFLKQFELFTNASTNKSDESVSIVTCVFENTAHFSKNIYKFKELNPDAVLITTNNTYVNVEQLKQIIYYSLGVSVDFVIMSHFKKLSDIICYSDKLEMYNNLDVVDIENDNIINIIKESILKRIGFPTSVKKI